MLREGTMNDTNENAIDVRDAVKRSRNFTALQITLSYKIIFSFALANLYFHTVKCVKLTSYLATKESSYFIRHSISHIDGLSCL